MASVADDHDVGSRQEGAWLNGHVRLDVAAYAIGVVALWFLFHPYDGIVHDSTIYIGRALADLHPETIGRQLSFVHDGQSKFSLFPLVCVFLVGHFGPNATAIFLSALGLILWIAAAAYLFSRFLKGPVFWASLLCLCVMPSAYGGDAVFHWAEPFATPRIFAEAACLAAIGAFMDRRVIATLGLLSVAMLLHPIIAAPAVLLLLLDLSIRDRRWAIGTIALGIVSIVGAVAHLPVIGRLIVFPDQMWLAVMNLQLFPASWPASDWALAACQFASAVSVWLLRREAASRIAVESAGLATAGVLVTIALPSLLILQVQPWRALWLLSVLAVGLVPTLARELWNQGHQGRTALAIFFFAWASYAAFPIAAPLGMMLVVALAAGKWKLPFPRWIAISVWTFAIALIAGQTAITAYAISVFHHLSPDGFILPTVDDIGFGFQVPMVVGAAIAIAIGSRSLPWVRPALLYSAAGALAILASASWDRRSGLERAIDSGQGSASLQARITSGSVFWRGVDNKSWLWTGRPEWWGIRQGAGIVFDRQLAAEWRRRLNLVVRAGLAERQTTEVRQLTAIERPMPLFDRHALETLCVRGGPDWIVYPQVRVATDVASAASGKWVAPAPQYLWQPSRHAMVPARTYLIFRCNPSP